MKRLNIVAALTTAISISTQAISSELPMGQPHPWQLGFQKAAAPMMVGITHMHDYLLIIIFIIGAFVSLLMGYIVWRYRAKKNPVPSTTTHHTMLEIVWTIIPTIIIAAIMIPSVRLIYEFEVPKDPEMTIKAIGKQWYWTYEYPVKDGHPLSFDSRMIETKDLKPGQLRLLEVDHQIVVPINTTIQLLVTAGDVIHSFAVPSLGIKKDAVPGRINETWMKIDKEGTYYGQCSELCGANHAFMPIAIKAVKKAEYEAWLKLMNKKH